ncbi:class I (I, L, M and V) tRNA synthetase, partial [Helicosporidium sp. ATCC 50920]
MLWSGRPLLLGSSSRPTPALPVHLGLRATTRCLSSKDGKADNPYNHTVNLPRTSFGMRANSAVQEPKIQAFWESEGIYESLSRNNPGAPFTLHDGPPYANGDLHIGHALNKILKDFINRYQLLRGRKAAFVPGWDCHGLPIELKALQAQQGASAAKGDAKSKKGGAERSSHPSPAPAPVPSPDAPESILALRATCAAFALAALDRQRAQFRRYGVWGDWGAPYVTLDPRYEAAQVRVFGAMALAGHVYRGLRPVHWSPASGTALAEAELEYPEAHVSQAAYVALPLSQPGPDLSSEQRRLLAGAALAVWTTTPWTLPANLAAAVHPDLQYAVVELDMPAQEASAGFGSEGGCCKSGASPLFPPSPASAPPAPVYAVRRLVVAADLAESLAATFGARSSAVLGTLAGRSLTQSLYRHPLVRRESPVLPADWVSADAGTGIVHCAPGHGMEDWQLGQAWGIGVLSPVDEQGRFTPEAGLPELQGLQVLGSGSDAALAALKRRGALLSVHQHAHKYPYDWRSKTPTIVRATQQWFASVGGFREAALKAGRGVQWVPSAGGARLEAMIAQRGDWCISRQRRWGVPIPAFYDLKSGEAVVDQETVEHVAQVFERQGSDAWWKLPLVDLLPGSKKHLAGSLRRGQDTMDVWFDSGSSWAGALGGLAGRNGAASTASLAGFNQPGSSPASPTASSPPPLNFPADVYLEGSDQSRGWFQSSLLTSVAVTGQAPFKTVLTHGFVLDERGAKMSKSLGNVVDPMGVILGGRGRPALGADVLRLWAASVDYSADVGVGDRALEAASESYKKLRLTLRYLLGNLSDFDPGRHALNASQLPLSDRAIVHRALELKSAAEAAYDEFKFYRAAALTQRFCSAELSAGHLDALKDRLYTSAP